ncbi:MAG: DUF4304 domain-containing protein [Fimbriiglobus sp.]
MSKTWLAGLLSELHRESLKPAGFRKETNTFFRDHDGYTERFNFQGSSGSSADETVFYLNVGVEFAEFGPATQNWVYFKNTHWACRVDTLVQTAPDVWRCDGKTDRAALKTQLAELVAQASEQIALRLPELRDAYLAGIALRG